MLAKYCLCSDNKIYRIESEIDGKVLLSNVDDKEGFIIREKDFIIDISNKLEIKNNNNNLEYSLRKV